MEEARRYNEAQAARYAKSAFGGVDLWFVLGGVVQVEPAGWVESVWFHQRVIKKASSFDVTST